MSERRVFSLNEKRCLQVLIIKYKLASTTALAAAEKKDAWVRLTDEFNSIVSNEQRTIGQLKKLWENMKTRRKAALVSKRMKERVKNGDDPLATGEPDNDVVADVLQLQFATDSNNLNYENNVDMAAGVKQETTFSELYPTEEVESSPSEVMTARVYAEPSTSSLNGLSQALGRKNVRCKFINQNITKVNQESIEKREEELHNLKVAEMKWKLKTALTQFKTAAIEKESADEVLRCKRAKREAAELLLEQLKKGDQFDIN